MKTNRTVLAGLALLAMIGCRGQPSSEPPIHLIPNMDTQEKYKPQSESKFFADKRTMRTPVEGTVARGFLKEDDAFYRGKTGETFVASMPIELTSELMARGQERFEIFCAPCHSKVGDGKGLVASRGLVPIPSYQDERLRNMPDGELYSAISNGVRTMPSYRHQIPEADRWAIVGYVRALQRAQNATINDIPEEKKAGLK